MPTNLPPPEPLSLPVRLLMPFWFWRTVLFRIRTKWLLWRGERVIARAARRRRRR
jgi:hypothetical protein